MLDKAWKSGHKKFHYVQFYIFSTMVAVILLESFVADLLRQICQVLNLFSEYYI